MGTGDKRRTDRSAPRLDVLVSLVNMNNRELLASCLDSLPGACEALRWGLIVVDNHSHDGSAEMVSREYGWARVIENRGPLGFAANQNQVVRPAIEEGTARYILVLNEDTELDPRCVTELVAFCDARPTVGAAGPAIRNGDGRPEASYFRFSTVRRELLYAIRPRGNALAAAPGQGWLNGSCLLLRTAALRQVGPFDERFFLFFEDGDLGLRLRRRGWGSAVCEPATIVHYGHRAVSRATSENGLMDRQIARSRYLYFLKHHGSARARMVAAIVRGAFLARAGKARAASVIRRDRAEGGDAALFLALARYDPRVPLAHEARGEHAPPV